ncbi:heparan-alpha-glucosaminide N-acetyltransferase [Glycine max]|uniref:heparan-alpha-glucosaminide N-acetyltransferase n=1 Tax=Glycine max TaxID=3847 RepID=UPI0003DE968C|nr:heparan-alpha-glucosaminide N-acetyltransferase [Glycine max]|eukprot:XP_006577710.3 heparan-alpha-glucosaminide N-acetyltransferase [Glycine max]
MDEDPKRMEEGLNSALNGDGNKDDLKKRATIKTSNGGSIFEHDKDTMAKPVAEGESVQQIAEQEQPPVKQKTKRVATLDAFRGLTIVLMILVDDAGEAYPRIDHSPWNGCTLADFVMPFFLFIVGVAIALALKRISKIKHSVKKIILRTLKLLFWGIILQGGYSHAPDDLEYGVNMKFIRWCGILQRIALVYCVVALIETFTTKLRPTTLASGHLSIFAAYKWFGGFVAFLIYMITTFSLYVPDWSFVDHFNGDEPKRYTVICGMRGHLGPACNAVGHVDRQVWGVNHLYSQPVWRRLKACTFSSPGSGPFRDDAPSWCLAPFEPEGLLSSISAILSGTIGIHYGHVLIHFKGHSERLKQWVSMGFVLLIIAIILHFTDALPINKQLYSFSYVCFTAGAAGIVFSGFYILIDVWGLRTPFLFLEWIGMNAMLVFVMAAEGIFAAFVNGWYYEDPRSSLVHWIKKHVFVNVWHSERVGTILYVIFAEITFWSVVAGVLHKLGIYWKL